MTFELADYLSYLLKEDHLWWTLVSAGYFIIGVYSGLTPRRDYPMWFWGSYLLISGAILFRISADYHWGQPVTTMSEYALLIVLVAVGIGGFRIVRVYAAHRKEIDEFLAEIREKERQRD